MTHPKTPFSLRQYAFMRPAARELEILGELITSHAPAERVTERATHNMSSATHNTSSSCAARAEVPQAAHERFGTGRWSRRCGNLGGSSRGAQAALFAAAGPLIQCWL